MIVLIHEETGGRLCQDGRFRGFASFGTYPECVKVYRKEGFALRRKDKLWAMGCKTSVFSVPAGKAMDATGNIF